MIFSLLGFFIDPFTRFHSQSTPRTDPESPSSGSMEPPESVGDTGLPSRTAGCPTASHLANLARNARTPADEETISALIGSDIHAIQFIDDFDEGLFGSTSLFARYIFALSTLEPGKAMDLLRRRSPEWRQAWVDENVRSMSPKFASLCLYDALGTPAGDPSNVRPESLPGLITRALISDPEQTLLLLADRAPQYLDTLPWKDIEITESGARSLLSRLPPSSPAACSLITQYARSLASESGLDTSIEWISEHSPRPDQDTLVSTLLDIVISEDPAAVAKAIAEEGISLTAEQCCELVRQFSSLDHDRARECIDTLPDEVDRDQLAATLYASPWASASERQALMDLAMTSSDDSVVGEAAARTIGRTTSIDIHTGRGLAEALPLGSLAQREAVAASVSAAAAWDPLGTSVWMAELPPESLSDSAIVSLLDAIPDDPGGALLWSTQLEDAGLRASRASAYAAAAHAQDPSAFLTYFHTLPLRADEKRLILESIHANAGE